MTLLLAVAGGGLDAAILLRFHVLTAAQTGNTILLAVALAQGRLAAGLYSAISVIFYLVGAALGELIVAECRDGERSPIARGLLAELVPLAALLACWQMAGPHPHTGLILALIASAAIAMGMQSAAVLRIHAGPTTTYVSGTVTLFATLGAEWLHRKAAAPTAADPRAQSGNLLSKEQPTIYGLDWIIYFSGAMASGALFFRSGEAALLLPVAAVVAATAVAFWRRGASTRKLLGPGCDPASSTGRRGGDSAAEMHRGEQTEWRSRSALEAGQAADQPHFARLGVRKLRN